MEIYSELLRNNEQVDYITAIYPNQHYILYEYFRKYLDNRIIRSCTVSAINKNGYEISLLTLNTKIKKRNFIKVLKHAIDIRNLLEIKVVITFWGPKNKVNSKCHYFFRVDT